MLNNRHIATYVVTKFLRLPPRRKIGTKIIIKRILLTGSMCIASKKATKKKEQVGKNMR